MVWFLDFNVHVILTGADVLGQQINGFSFMYMYKYTKQIKYRSPERESVCVVHCLPRPDSILIFDRSLACSK